MSDSTRDREDFSQWPQTEILKSGSQPSGDVSIDSLIQDLKNSEWRIRKNAASTLENLGEKAVPNLSRNLYSDNPDVRYWSTIVLARIGGQGIGSLIKILVDGDKDMRSFAAKALSETKDQSVIQPLIQALGDSSWKVRKNSAESLLSMGNMVIKPVVQALRNDNEDVRYWATKILGEMGEDGIEPLIILLSKGNKDMRFFAAEALGESSNPLAIEKLIEALGDKSWSVRKNAAKSLQNVGEASIQPLAAALSHINPDVRHWASRILGRIGNKAIASLIKQLKDSDNEVRTLTKDVIDSIGDLAVEPLISILEKGDREMRKNAAEALGNTKSERAIKPLIRSLADESWFVRKNAAEALEEMGKIAVSHLTKALESENEDIMYWSVRILGQIGIDDIVPLVAVLKSRNQDSRYFAVEALGKTTDPNAVKYLISSLSDECWPIRRKAAECLARMRTLSLPDLIRALKEENQDVRYWSKRVLRSIGPAALEPLHDMLVSGDADTKIYATFALGEIGDRRSIASLVSALTDDNEWVRRYAATSLAQLKMEEVVEPLMECLRNEEDDMCLWVSKALAGLGEIAAPTLMRGLESRNAKVERYSATALAEMGDERAIQPLVKLFLDAEEDMTFWLYKDLKKFGAKVVDVLVGQLKKPNGASINRICDLIYEMDNCTKEKFITLSGELPKSRELEAWTAKIQRTLKSSKVRKG
jgi:HEAT repeat protein